MPFEPISPVGGFTASPEIQRPEEETDSSLLGTLGKVAAPVAVGAGLVLAPEFTIPALAAGAIGSAYANPEAFSSAFRTENTIGSLMASQDLADDHLPRDPHFDPWAEIADTPYEPYYEQFARARNPMHFQAIKADIDRENTDRDIISRSGVAGMVATMAAGTLDLPSLVPGGALVRTAKGAR